MRPQQIVECYTQRWSIETTFQECREYLKLESTKGYCQATVLRFSPCLLGLYTAIVLLYLQLPKTSRTLRAVFWKGKTTVTFSDMMTCVRRAICEQWFFHTPDDRKAFSKLSGGVDLDLRGCQLRYLAARIGTRVPRVVGHQQGPAPVPVAAVAVGREVGRRCSQKPFQRVVRRRPLIERVCGIQQILGCRHVRSVRDDPSRCRWVEVVTGHIVDRETLLARKLDDAEVPLFSPKPPSSSRNNLVADLSSLQREFIGPPIGGSSPLGPQLMLPESSSAMAISSLLTVALRLNCRLWPAPNVGPGRYC